MERPENLPTSLHCPRVRLGQAKAFFSGHPLRFSLVKKISISCTSFDDFQLNFMCFVNNNVSYLFTMKIVPLDSH